MQKKITHFSHQQHRENSHSQQMEDESWASYDSELSAYFSVDEQDQESVHSEKSEQRKAVEQVEKDLKKPTQLFGAFNVNRSYTADTGTELVIEGNFDYLACLEPHFSAQLRKKLLTNLDNMTARSYGYEPRETPYAQMLVDQERLNYGSQGIAKSQFDGRLVTQVFLLDDKTPLTVISVYNVCQGTDCIRTIPTATYSETRWNRQYSKK